MPSSVLDLLEEIGIDHTGVVQWNEPLPENRTGIYLVSVNEDADDPFSTLDVAPINHAAVEELLRACPTLALDDKSNPGAPAITERLSEYWLPDEPVLYIGLSGQPLRSRVRQYYKTPLGAAKPHAGGWWLKTLANLPRLYVHFAVTDEYKEAEEEALDVFARNVSPESAERLPQGQPVTPFANLRDGQWRRRNHGIRNATSASPASQASNSREPTSTQLKQREDASPPRRQSSRTPHFRSQPVTAKDIEAGRVRVPAQTKRLFSQEPGKIKFTLRGRPLEGRWNPRFGPRERSGVLWVGKRNAQELLQPGDLLAVDKGSDGNLLLD